MPSRLCPVPRLVAIYGYSRSFPSSLRACRFFVRTPVPFPYFSDDSILDFLRTPAPREDRRGNARLIFRSDGAVFPFPVLNLVLLVISSFRRDLSTFSAFHFRGEAGAGPVPPTPVRQTAPCLFLSWKFFFSSRLSLYLLFS